MNTETKTGSQLEVSGVGKTIGGTRILEGVSFKLSPGECFGVVGENGSGKTTLLRIVTGLVAPTEGRVLIGGASPHNDPVSALARIGALIGIPAFYPNMSAYKNLLLFWDGPGTAAETHIMNALSAVGLASEEGKKVGAYSRGMLQRLGIAHAFMHQRPYIILDEPTQGVDEYWTARLTELIAGMVRTGKTFIITSHDFDFILRLCPRALILQDGKPVHVGEIKALAEYPYFFHLRATPGDTAAAVIGRLKYVHKCVRTDEGFFLTLAEGQASDLVAALTASGCAVHECAKKLYSIADLIRQRNG